MAMIDNPSLTYHKGDWIAGNQPLFGALSHGVWLGSFVFDGARGIGGLIPDLLPHCERIIRSAKLLGLEPQTTAANLMQIAIDGIIKLGRDKDYYIKPMIWADDGFIIPNAETTELAVTVWEMPMPDFNKGSRIALSRYRRPACDQALTEVKGSCHYPQSSRVMQDAKARGFHNAVVCDANGNIAELASANIFMIRDGELLTPLWNRTFLNGITRQRLLVLAKELGIKARETSLTANDLCQADELFASGNYGKVTPIIAFEDRELPIGPLTRRLRDSYFDFAASHRL